jgi:hypothetical protein
MIVSRRQDTQHAQARRGINTGVWRKNKKERDHWEDLDVGWKIILKWILGKLDGGWYGLDSSGLG